MIYSLLLETNVFGIHEPKRYIQWYDFNGPILAGERWNFSLVSIWSIYDGTRQTLRPSASLHTAEQHVRGGHLTVSIYPLDCNDYETIVVHVSDFYHSENADWHCTDYWVVGRRRALD